MKTLITKLISSSKITTSLISISRNFTTQITNSSSSIYKSPFRNLKFCSNSNGLFYKPYKIHHFLKNPSQNFNTSASIPVQAPGTLRLFLKAMESYAPGIRTPYNRRSNSEWKKAYFRQLKKKREWLLVLKKKSACRVLLKSRYLRSLHSSMEEKDLEKPQKFRYKKVCLGSNFAEYNRMKRHFYQSVILNLISKKRGNDKNLNLPTRTRSSTGYNYRYSYLKYCCASSYPFSMRIKNKSKSKRIRKINLATHYLEANYRTQKAVMFYGPSVAHIPFKW